MTDVKRVSVEDAKALVEEGYVYLDVRSEQEFAQGHVPGAYNVPVSRVGPGGMVSNADFLAVIQRTFRRDARIVVGCKTGVRSLKAARELMSAGYVRVVEMRPGWEGARDAFGRLEPGWRRCGLPVEKGQPARRCYSDLERPG